MLKGSVHNRCITLNRDTEDRPSRYVQVSLDRIKSFKHSSSSEHVGRVISWQMKSNVLQHIISAVNVPRCFLVQLMKRLRYKGRPCFIPLIAHHYRTAVILPYHLETG